MATVGKTMPTLYDLAKRKDPNGKQAKILEILTERNDILEDAPAVECNDGTVHRTTLRSEIPEAAARLINKGVPVVKTRTTQVDEATTAIAAWANADELELELAPDKNEFLLSESRGILEGMNQQMATKLFYGNRGADSADINGFAKRYWSRNPDKCDFAENILDMGGTGANLTSAWLLNWGVDLMHLLYPKGTTSGVKMKKYDNQVLTDEDDMGFPGVRTYFEWLIGLALRDWRYGVRLANIDVSSLDTLIGSGAGDAASQKLIRAMVRMTDLVPNLNAGKSAFYLNRDVHSMLHLMALEKNNVYLTIEQFDGKPVTTFRGIPLRRVDALIAGEDAVTAA